ncbi:MAG: hypothetical protein WDO74_10945 [Pseudomonadota bacterium]
MANEKPGGLRAAAPRTWPLRVVAAPPPDIEAGLTEQQQALANLFIAFQGAQGLEGQSVTQAQRDALNDVVVFVMSLAVGGGSEADWGRLARMRGDLKGHTDPKRALVLHRVRSALASTDLENRAGNCLFGLIEWVDPDFKRLTKTFVQDEFDNRGRRGIHAIAARLSIACGAFGDRGSEKTIASRYEKAERGLRESARAISSKHQRSDAKPPRGLKSDDPPWTTGAPCT